MQQVANYEQKNVVKFLKTERLSHTCLETGFSLNNNNEAILIMEMEKLHKDILIRMRKELVDDMDVYNGIIEPLELQRILTTEDITEIDKGSTPEARAEILLDILPSRGSAAFAVFHEALNRHYWWLNKKITSYLLEEIKLDSSSVSIHIGYPNTMPDSELTVPREEKMEQLKDAFEKLVPNGYITLHGMKGYGKSCLTANVLKDDKLVSKLFHNEVYWIKFRNERPLEEEISIELHTLYHIISNLEVPSDLIRQEFSRDALICSLKVHFGKKSHCNALLILEDVFDKEIINVFDFKCKTLVITTDRSVLDGRNSIIIKMNDGFTETETLQLFAKALDTEVEKLPWEAQQIHKECKGMPLLITMFASQFQEFKDDMKIHKERWKHYLNSLRKKDSKNLIMKQFLEKQKAIFSMCINQLEPAIKERYIELCIFNENVNIMAKTLGILWDTTEHAAEDTMVILCHKSLAAKRWNSDLECYIYGVHDLLLCHLKKKLGKAKIVEMHKLFIEKYRKYCMDDFAKLPQDNYSHSYIGYHLAQAELYDEFPELYLNLDFIEAKIRHSGVNDLLFDLQIYRKYITKDNDEECNIKVKDLEKFLREQASILAEHRRKNCLDLIQIAMSHPHQGYITESAKKLAAERLQNLYLSHEKRLKYVININRALSEEICMDVCTSSFVRDPDEILIGNKAGEITLWDYGCTIQQQKIFRGNNKNVSIKKIVVSEKQDCFLSLNNVGEVKLFILKQDETLYSDLLPIQSPKQKQFSWNDIFANDSNLQDDSSWTFKIKNEIILDVAFEPNSNCVAACTDKGTITIWDVHGNVLTETRNPHQSGFTKITFTTFNVPGTTQTIISLHAVDDTSGALITYSKYDGEYMYSSQWNLLRLNENKRKKIIYFNRVPEYQDSLIVVTESEAVLVKWFRTHDQMRSYGKQEKANIENDRIFYVCATISHDGLYLVTADSGGFVNVWQLHEGYQPIATYKSRVTSLDTFWLRDDGYHIICGNENNLLHRWKLPVEDNPKPVRKPSFDAIVQSFGEMDTVVKETFTNTIAMLLGDQVIAESPRVDGKITTLKLSTDGKKVVYVTEKATVGLFNGETNQHSNVLKLTNPTDFITFLNIKDKDLIICKDGNDLKICRNAKITHLIKDVGNIMSVYLVNNDHIVTVAQNGVITLWNINDIWERRCTIAPDDRKIYTYYSVSKIYKDNFLLGVIRENQELVLYKLPLYNLYSVPAHLYMEEYFRYYFSEKTTCCDISHNNQYLAVGFESGDIAIFDIKTRKEIHKLLFHSTAVNLLCWAPATVELPILLSVSSDELIFWNIALANNSHQRRHSYRNINRSLSTPAIGANTSFSVQEPTSQSVSDSITESGSYLVSEYWKNKVGKDPRRPALLSVVQLPPSCPGKVCISNDFSKFLSVDIHGFISTFKLFECN